MPHIEQVFDRRAMNAVFVGYKTESSSLTDGSIVLRILMGFHTNGTLLRSDSLRARL